MSLMPSRIASITWSGGSFTNLIDSSAMSRSNSSCLSTATLAARYSGRQYSNLDNSDTNPFTYFGASHYLTLDLRLRWQIDRQWSAAFGIDNLNNQQFWAFHPYPQRTYHAQLQFDL